MFLPDASQSRVRDGIEKFALSIVQTLKAPAGRACAAFAKPPLARSAPALPLGAAGAAGAVVHANGQ